MTNKEVLLRFFLVNYAGKEEAFIGKINYLPEEASMLVVPRVDERLHLEEVMEEDYCEDYDYYVVTAVDYSYTSNQGVMIDVMVNGEYYEYYDDDAYDYYRDNFDEDIEPCESCEPCCKHNRRLFLDEEGYFDY